MPEIGTSSSMSGDGKRSVGHRPQATAPVLDSTIATEIHVAWHVGNQGKSGPIVLSGSVSHFDPSVWTGRALQAESAEWQQLVLRFCIRPLVEQIAPGHHGYPRASDLILG
jgi:hypothetical protein